jgi:uncharacterized protein YcbK (DUF882 family)
MQLSEHFTLEELTFSQTAARHDYDNTPNAEQIENLRQLCVHILEPLRAACNAPIRITSGYRSPKVNAAVGSKPSSQHLQGQAADFHVDGMSIKEIIAKVQELNLPFDQLIDEFSGNGGGWVHVSYSPRHRRQVLKIG